MAEKAVVLVLADTESHEGLGRVVNALQLAREFKASGDEVAVIFDGAGTKWPGVLSEPNHPAHGLYASVADSIAGACKYCANAFGATAGVEQAGLRLLDENEGHPSLRQYAAQGYIPFTF